MIDLNRERQNEPENRESKAFDAGERRTPDLEKTAWYKAYNQCDRHSFEPYHGDKADTDDEKDVIKGCFESGMTNDNI